MKNDDFGKQLLQNIWDDDNAGFEKSLKTVQSLSDHYRKKKKEDNDEKSDQQVNKGDSAIIDIDYIINEAVYSDGDSEKPLIVAAALYNNMSILQTLLGIKNINVDAVDSENHNALFCACQNSNLEMARLLMSKDSNPNLVGNDKFKYTTMMMAVVYGNRDLMELLLNLSKTYKHSFDWNKFINHCDGANGMSVFHVSRGLSKLYKVFTIS